MNNDLTNFKKHQTGQPQSLELSTVSKKIVEFYNSAKKIRQFDANDLINLSKCLQGCAFDVGIKDPIEESNLVRITEFIQRNYLDLSIEQISLAFEMALTGKLDLDQNDLEHYQQFSMLYISKILNSFKELQTIKIKDHQLTKPEPAKKIIMETEKEYKERNIIATLNLYQAYKIGEKVIDFDNLTFKYLYKRGLIQFTEVEIKSAKNKAYKQWLSDLAKESITANQVQLPILTAKIASLQSKKFTESDLKIISSKARTIALCELFQEWRDFEVNVFELLNK